MKGRKTKYNAEKVAKICKAIADGESYKMACSRAGISDDTFARWRVVYPDFAEAVKKAEQEYDNWFTNEIVRDCKKSLKTLICGAEYEETTVEYDNDADGNPRIKKQKTVTKKIMPNPTAVIFTLCNRDPENWKNRQDITGEIKTETKSDVSLTNVPDDLLAQVLDAIDGKD